ncbi:MAG: hypothetical protein ACF8SC_02445 [Phycisphaerales bacterium JB037]
MLASRRLSLTMVVLSALPWAVGWLVLGLWLLLTLTRPDESLGLFIPGSIRLAAALTAIGAGQLVFMCFIADRVFPEAHRGVVWSFEIMASVLVLFGAAAMTVQILGLWFLGGS